MGTAWSLLLLAYIMSILNNTSLFFQLRNLLSAAEVIVFRNWQWFNGYILLVAEKSRSGIPPRDVERFRCFHKTTWKFVFHELLSSYRNILCENIWTNICEVMLCVWPILCYLFCVLPIRFIFVVEGTVTLTNVSGISDKLPVRVLNWLFTMHIVPKSWNMMVSIALDPFWGNDCILTRCNSKAVHCKLYKNISVRIKAVDYHWYSLY